MPEQPLDLSGESEPTLNTPTERALYRDCARYKAERDRYSEALKRIANTPTYTDPSGGITGAFCSAYAVEQARKALK